MFRLIAVHQIIAGGIRGVGVVYRAMRLRDFKFFPFFFRSVSRFIRAVEELFPRFFKCLFAYEYIEDAVFFVAQSYAADAIFATDAIKEIGG